jgi:predicted nucleic acid-binding protein
VSTGTCIDASIVAKLILVEADSNQAEGLIRHLQGTGDPLLSPFHLHAEVTSAVYKRLRDGFTTLEEATQALDDLAMITLHLSHPEGITQRALGIAAQLSLKYPYDAFYLALGDLLDCDVWTADRALYAAAHTTFARLRLLSDYGPSQE